MNMLPSPDWVMFGIREGDSVALWASSTLSFVQLETEYLHPRFAGSYSYFPDGTTERTTMTVTMGDHVVVHAPDYETAFRTLFGKWSPEPAPLELEM